ncbi:MAG: hypothetical protein V1839_03505 [archaeon]
MGPDLTKEIEDADDDRKSILKWFGKKPNVTFQSGILGTEAIVQVTEKSYANIEPRTHFAGENIGYKKLPEKMKGTPWFGLWVLARFPALYANPDDDRSDETALASLVAKAAKPALIAAAKRHGIYALYNACSWDTGGGQKESGSDEYALSLGVFHPVEIKDMQRLYDGILDFGKILPQIRALAENSQKGLEEQVKNLEIRISRLENK